MVAASGEGAATGLFRMIGEFLSGIFGGGDATGCPGGTQNCHPRPCGGATGGGGGAVPPVAGPGDFYSTDKEP